MARRGKFVCFSRQGLLHNSAKICQFAVCQRKLSSAMEVSKNGSFSLQRVLLYLDARDVDIRLICALLTVVYCCVQMKFSGCGTANFQGRHLDDRMCHNKNKEKKRSFHTRFVRQGPNAIVVNHTCCKIVCLESCDKSSCSRSGAVIQTHHRVRQTPTVSRWITHN